MQSVCFAILTNYFVSELLFTKKNRKNEYGPDNFLIQNNSLVKSMSYKDLKTNWNFIKEKDMRRVTETSLPHIFKPSEILI